MPDGWLVAVPVGADLRVCLIRRHADGLALEGRVAEILHSQARV